MDRKRRNQTDLTSGLALGMFITICTQTALVFAFFRRGIIGDVVTALLAAAIWLALRGKRRDVADGWILGAAIILISTSPPVTHYISQGWHP